MLFLLLIACFVLGSIPSGPIIARRLKGVDLRKIGSGNVGATNAFRALGTKGALAVLAADMAKGYLAVLLASLALVPSFLAPVTRCAFGMAAILGHNYSPFLAFRGGKGIATTFGVILALSPRVGLMCILLWIGVVALTRMSSAGSLAGAAAAPLLMIFYGDPLTYVLFSAVAALFAFYRHRDNLRRIREGTENRFGE